MKQSQLFTKTKHQVPKDEVSYNAQLLSRAGFISKEMAGVYSLLPLGLKVLRKIEAIIREEINNIGGQELTLTVLQDPEPWKASGRWDDKVVDVWFKTKLNNGTEIGLGNTHEEPLARIMKQHINSYKDLPRFVYQIQTKFRNELRAKSGLMRGREFLMKDLYSFTRDQQELDEFYEQCATAYLKIFERVGIGDKTYRTFASGGIFSKFSDEFQTLCESGEDTIYLDRNKKIAVNKEIFNLEKNNLETVNNGIFSDEVLAELSVNEDNLEEVKAIEVGNIFKLGTKYSEAVGLYFVDQDGSRKPVVMGSYGIGLGRLMGTIIEICHDDRGIIWPESVAPYHIHLLEIKNPKSEIRNKVEKIYSDLKEDEIEVLWDDRDVSAGEKFSDADLMGIPYRLVVSDKTLKQDSVEVKKRDSDQIEMVKVDNLISFFKS